MIKGSERRMIYIRDTGSNLFREAYFVLRENAPASSEKDMIAEAERIIRERFVPGAVKKRRDKKTFIGGFLCATVIFGAVVLILTLAL